MKLIAAAVVLLAGLGCGHVDSTSQLAGRAQDDAVTAKLRETFTAGRVTIQAAALTTPGGWDCLFHATTNAIVYRGISDFEYHSTFSRRGVMFDELGENVHTGDLALSPWQEPSVLTDAGLRGDGHYFSRVARVATDLSLIVEWSYTAGDRDLRGDESIAIADKRTAGYSVCTTTAQLR